MSWLRQILESEQVRDVPIFISSRRMTDKPPKTVKSEYWKKWERKEKEIDESTSACIALNVCLPGGTSGESMDDLVSSVTSDRIRH